MANPAAQTAVGPMTIVAVEQFTPKAQRLIHDELAYAFLPKNAQWFVKLAQWLPVRNALMKTTNTMAAGLWGSMLCRKRYGDDLLRAAAGSIDSVVILGAGLDTRAYRLAELQSLPVFEVDLPENSAYKQARVQAVFGKVPSHVQLVATDFEQHNLANALADHGFKSGQRTFFVWEAVTQYLEEAAVRATFDVMAKAAEGSRLLFTFVRQDFMDGNTMLDAEPMYKRFREKQQLWRFGMVPEQVPTFLETYDWQQCEQLGGREFSKRYVAETGRELPISEVERSVYAEKYVSANAQTCREPESPARL